MYFPAGPFSVKNPQFGSMKVLGPNEEPLGIIAFRRDPDSFFRRLISCHPDKSKTSEYFRMVESPPENKKTSFLGLKVELSYTDRQWKVLDGVGQFVGMVRRETHWSMRCDWLVWKTEKDRILVKSHQKLFEPRWKTRYSLCTDSCEVGAIQERWGQKLICTLAQDDAIDKRLLCALMVQQISQGYSSGD